MKEQVLRTISRMATPIEADQVVVSVPFLAVLQGSMPGAVDVVANVVSQAASAAAIAGFQQVGSSDTWNKPSANIDSSDCVHEKT